jgi:hypothetical protein
MTGKKRLCLLLQNGLMVDLTKELSAFLANGSQLSGPM